MCFRTFNGFICGHCDLPVTHPCPITRQNPLFPNCKYIAERPTLVPWYCNPCSRVAWTQDVILQEEIHAELHKEGVCPCGFDYTEEERQRTKASLPKKRSTGKEVAQVKGSLSGIRQENHQVRKVIQETYPRPDNKQESSQRQEAFSYMEAGYQTLDPPFRQYPILLTPNHRAYRPFRPYRPQHAFVGVPAPPVYDHREEQSAATLRNGTRVMTEPVMMSERQKAASISLVDTQAIEDAKAPDQTFAKDQLIEEVPADDQVPPMAEETCLDTLDVALSPVNVSSGMVAPPRPHSVPRYESTRERWDIRSI